MPVQQSALVPAAIARRFSDYVVYVDESGDHSLASIDRDYPVFVLALCVIHKRHYAEKIIPAVEKLKFNYFGHDSVVLHEHEIRKQKGDFAFLSHRPTRAEFMAQLSAIMDASNFVLDLLKKKFFCDGGRAGVGMGYQSVGLRIYPPQKAKSPDEPTEAVAPTGNPQST
jgi:hypothetical protein